MEKIVWSHWTRLLVVEPSVEQDDSNMLQIDEGLIQHLSSKDEKGSCDSEWEFEDGCVFNVIAQELQEFLRNFGGE